MADPTPDPALTAFAAALAGAAPSPGALNRDRLLFAAGRASARPRRLWVWPAAAAALALLAAGEGAWLWRRLPEVVERIVVVHMPPGPEASPVTAKPTLPEAPPGAEPEPGAIASARDWEDGLRLRREVLQNGVAALPAPQAWPPAPTAGGDNPLGQPGGEYSPRDLLYPRSKGDLTP